ncbi:MAG: hypothetical protein EXX96DRAFT_534856 [Benjaminiella poitrasii]|nr:MAG: hypothetical protein EXX96DRAFT_534856 [Benjaminiella poitrasii]
MRKRVETQLRQILKAQHVHPTKTLVIHLLEARNAQITILHCKITIKKLWFKISKLQPQYPHVLFLEETWIEVNGIEGMDITIDLYGVKNYEQVLSDACKTCNSCLTNNLENLKCGNDDDIHKIHQISICKSCNIYWNRDVMAAKKHYLPLMNLYGTTMVASKSLEDKAPPPMWLPRPHWRKFNESYR